MVLATGEAAGPIPEYTRLLLELQQERCTIQAAISEFGEKTHTEMDKLNNFRCLSEQIVQWRRNASARLRHLSLDHKGSNLREFEEARAYLDQVLTYEKATIIYLHLVYASGRPLPHPQSVDVCEQASEHILALTQRALLRANQPVAL